MIIEQQKYVDYGEIINIYKNANRIFSATIELCHTCNWDCKHCYLDEHSKKGLSYEKILTILDELRYLGCMEITYTGGEIFTREDVMEIIKVTRQMGFVVSLMSNMSLLNERIITALKDMNIEVIECSIYSLEAEKHNAFIGCKENMLEKTQSNIRRCLNHGIAVKAGFIPMTINKDEMLKFADYCTKNGIIAKYDCRIMPRKNGDKSPQKFQLVGKDLYKALAFADKAMGVEYERKSEQYLCESMKTNIIIGVDGDVRPCLLLDIPLGYIDSGKSIEMIIKSAREQYEALRDAKWKDLDGECAACSLKRYCVRCPGIVLKEKGRLAGCSESNILLAKTREEIYLENEKNSI